MLTYYNDPKHKKSLESFVKTFKTKHYYASESFDELEDFQKEEIKNGLALQADDSGSFSDVFYVKDMALKAHSRFDFDHTDFEFEFGIIPALGAYDYEVLHDLGDNPYTPKLYAHFEDRFLFTSVVERIEGKSLKDIGFRNQIDFVRLKDFLIKMHNYVFEKEWVPMDISSTNIIVTPKGDFKLIDFSCFYPSHDLHNIFELTLKNIENVKNDKCALEKHVDEIIENINISLAYKEKDLVFLSNL